MMQTANKILKKAGRWALTGFAVVAAAACSDDPTGPATPAPNAVAVSTPQTVIVVGGTVQLTAIVYDQSGRTIAGAPVTWQSMNPTVASVSATGLVTGLAVGSAVVRATSGERFGELTITVESDPCTTPISLQPGQVRVLSGPQAVACVTLAATTGPTDFLFVTSNASQEQDNEGFYSVAVNLGGAVASAQPRAAPQLDAAMLQAIEAVEFVDDIESKVRAQERDIFRRTKPALRSRSVGRETAAAAISAAVVAEGDTITYRVPNVLASNLCTSYTETRAVVKKLSAHATIVQDINAPSGGFTASDFNAIAVEFENLIYPTDTLYFGRETDRNGDARVTILYTPEVNRATSQGSAGFIAGFFWGGDLVKKSEYQQFGVNCPQTNEQEIFYLLVPDPNGDINGNRRTVDVVRQNTRGTIAHEFQHMINQGLRLLNPAVDSTETPWLNEALSHMAEEVVGRALRGFSDFQPLGWSHVNPNPSSPDDYDAFFRQNFVRLRGWMQRPDTSSPTSNKARNQLAPRGAGWMFLRYVTDHHSNNNMKAFLRRVVAGPDIGLRNLLQHANNAQFDDILSGWLVSQFVDGMNVSGLDPRYNIASWNVRDVMSSSNNNVFPLLVTGLPATVATKSISGSGNFFRLTRQSASPQATFRMLGPGGSNVTFPGARVYVVRLN